MRLPCVSTRRVKAFLPLYFHEYPNGTDQALARVWVQWGEIVKRPVSINV